MHIGSEGETDGYGRQVPERGRRSQGKVKEKAGEATDDRDLEAEGEADETKANVKQAGEKVKDAFKD